MTKQQLHKKDKIITPLIEQEAVALSDFSEPSGTRYVCPYNVSLSYQQ